MDAVQLQPETLAAFDQHIAAAEAGMAPALHGQGIFLWSDESAERIAELQHAGAIARFWSGQHPLPVPGGLIHDWIGAGFIPGATIENTLALVQDYDNHKNIYRPEVIDSRLLSRNGADFEIYLRLLKKKVKTVVLDTIHQVHYSSPAPGRWCCASRTTRVAEIENAGKAAEKAQPPDTGHGFLWRLASYWRFEQKEGGVGIQCRAISLSRDVPNGFGWMIEPIIKKLPRESLLATLRQTRLALTPAGS